MAGSTTAQRRHKAQEAIKRTQHNDNDKAHTTHHSPKSKDDAQAQMMKTPLLRYRYALEPDYKFIVCNKLNQNGYQRDEDWTL